MDTDLGAQDAITLLPVVERATDRIAHVVADQQLQPGQPSLLPGWTIANVLSHLWYGAVASLRMTEHVLEGHGEVDFYPGGPAEREESIRSGDTLLPDALVQRLREASNELAATWGQLHARDWNRTFVEPRLGPIALTRLVALRLTELEVHHTDMGTGYDPEDWEPTFVDRCLPLRVAWLPHHRTRSDANLSINGRWCLHVHHGPSWIVAANGQHAQVEPGEDETARKLAGSGEQVLAMLLGRTAHVEPAEELARFKQAFPGP